MPNSPAVAIRPLKIATKCAPEAAALELAVHAGFRHVELWLNSTVLSRTQTLIPLARRFPLEYALHFPNALNLSHETLQQVATLYRELDCGCLVIHEPMWHKFHAALETLEPGITFAVENHVLKPAAFDTWAASFAGLTLDVEHLWKFTWQDIRLDELLKKLRAFLSAWHPKLRHVHLPGYVPGFEEHRPMYCSRDLVFAVWSNLMELDFQGLVVSEVGLEYQTANDLRMDVLLFETWCARRCGPTNTTDSDQRL